MSTFSRLHCARATEELRGPGCDCCHPLPGKTPPSSRVTAPPIGCCRCSEAGAVGGISPLSRHSYITTTNAHKDQDNTLNTHKKKGWGVGGARRREQRGEVQGDRGEGGRGQRGIGFLVNKTDRKWPFYTPFRRCGRAASVDVNGDKS